MISIEDSMITFRKDLQSFELSSEDGRPIYENIGTSHCPNDLLEDVADSLTILSLDSNSLISLEEEEEDLLEGAGNSIKKRYNNNSKLRYRLPSTEKFLSRLSARKSRKTLRLSRQKSESIILETVKKSLNSIVSRSAHGSAKILRSKTVQNCDAIIGKKKLQRFYTLTGDEKIINFITYSQNSNKKLSNELISSSFSSSNSSLVESSSRLEITAEQEPITCGTHDCLIKFDEIEKNTRIITGEAIIEGINQAIIGGKNFKEKESERVKNLPYLTALQESTKTVKKSNKKSASKPQFSLPKKFYIKNSLEKIKIRPVKSAWATIDDNPNLGRDPGRSRSIEKKSFSGLNSKKLNIERCYPKSLKSVLPATYTSYSSIPTSFKLVRKSATRKSRFANSNVNRNNKRINSVYDQTNNSTNNKVNTNNNKQISSKSSHYNRIRSTKSHDKFTKKSSILSVRNAIELKSPIPIGCSLSMIDNSHKINVDEKLKIKSRKTQIRTTAKRIGTELKGLVSNRRKVYQGDQMGSNQDIECCLPKFFKV